MCDMKYDIITFIHISFIGTYVPRSKQIWIDIFIHTSMPHLLRIVATQEMAVELI